MVLVPCIKQKLEKHQACGSSIAHQSLLNSLLQEGHWYIEDASSETLLFDHWPVGINSGDLLALITNEPKQSQGPTINAGRGHQQLFTPLSLQKIPSDIDLSKILQGLEKAGGKRHHNKFNVKSRIAQSEESNSDYGSQESMDRPYVGSSFLTKPCNESWRMPSPRLGAFVDSYDGVPLTSSFKSPSFRKSKGTMKPSTTSSSYASSYYDPLYSSQDHNSGKFAQGSALIDAIGSCPSMFSTIPEPTIRDTPENIFITAYFNLRLPCIFPPPPQTKHQKCSFAPTTYYWKALKALSGGSNKTFDVHRLILTQRADGEKLLQIECKVAGARDRTLADFGFTGVYEGNDTSYYLLLS